MNPYHNILTLKGDGAIVQECFENIKNADSLIDFNNIIPKPFWVKKEDWQEEWWGCRFNASETMRADNAISFDTDSIPVPVIEALSSYFPELQLELAVSFLSEEEGNLQFKLMACDGRIFNNDNLLSKRERRKK